MTGHNNESVLIQDRELDVDLLMIVAALGAAGLGLWHREYPLIMDGAILILIFAISGALEGVAMRRTERSIQALMGVTPDTARVLRGGQPQVIAIDQLQVGDEVLVKPGELVPTDCLVLAGTSTINEASITGESLPIEKRPGQTVFGGTINGKGTLTLRVHQPPQSSLIRRIIQLVQQAQTTAPPSQRFIERFEHGYCSGGGWDGPFSGDRDAISLAVGLGNHDLSSADLFSGGISLCPDGLDYANAAIRNRPGCPMRHSIQKWSGSRNAGSGTRDPIGAAIAHLAQQKDLTLPLATAIQAATGHGIQGLIQGKPTWVGKLAQESSIPTDPSIKAVGHRTNRYATGDNARTTQQIAQAVGIDRVYAELLPEDKIHILQQLQQQYQTVAMIGDGWTN